MLITDAYRQQQRVMHENPNYGVASVQFAPIVAQIINKIQLTDMLDYGCGKMRLFEALRGKVKHEMKVQAYDPGIARYDTPPVPSNFVTCIDVLEHIEPDCLDSVLDDLRRLTIFCGFFSVHCGAAAKTLPDGRNAHLIQEPPTWWLPKLMDRFDIQTFQVVQNGFYVIVYAKKISVFT